MPSESNPLPVSKEIRIARSSLARRITTQKYIIKKNEAALAELPQEIADLERQLAALDVTFGLHEIQLDPKRIKGKGTRTVTQPQGAMLRHALKFIRLSEDKTFSTNELCSYLVRNNAMGTSETSLASRNRTRRVITWLQKDGLVSELLSDSGEKLNLWKAAAVFEAQ